MAHHDLLIIGSGSGNMLVTPDFDDWSVAIVERGVFGGTCLNRGCIPSKMLVYPAEIAELSRHVGPRLGVRSRVDGIEWTEIRDRIFGRIDPIAAAGEHYRDVEQDHVRVYRGEGRFVGDKELEVEFNDGGTEIVTADQIVLAAGASATIPAVVADSGVAYDTSDTIMRIDEPPEHLIVLGGGYIGAELGNVFGMFGSRVTIVNRGDCLLRWEDPEISSRFTAAYAAKFDLRLQATVTAVESHPEGIAVTIDREGVIDTIVGDRLLVATGRAPNGRELGVEATGVELDGRGYVVTDEFLQTRVPGIWALGDITNPEQLKHTANAEARVVAHNIAHPDDRRAIDRRLTPYAVFGHPQVASVGLTEPQAIATGHEISVAVRSYGATAYGWAMEDTTSVCKLIADTHSRVLLGAHIIGPQASTLIQQLIQGMTFGQTVDEMASGQLYIHPALSEVVEQALLDL